jgi:protein TonB
MAQTLAMRATALAGSATLLALLTMAALSVSYTVQLMLAQEPRAVVSVIEPEPPPPLEEPPIRQAQPIEPATPIVFDAATPVIDSTAPPVETMLPIGQGPVTIESPRWLERPRDLARYYPRRAVTRGMEGEVTLDCLVSTAGLLRCSVASETPANWGFGDAALRIAHEHQMVPATRNGVSVEGRYRMRVPFELE